MQAVANIFVFVLQYITNRMWEDFSKQLLLWAKTAFFNPLPIVQNPAVQLVQAASTGVALAALTALIVVYATKAKVDSVDGTAPPASALAKNALWAGIAVAGINLIATVMGQMSSDAITDLLRMDVSQLFSQAFAAAPLQVAGANWMLTQGLLGLGVVIGGIAVTIQKMIMIGEFMVLLVIGPLAAVSILNGGRGWSLWWREALALTMTPVLQVLLVWLFVLQFISGGNDPTGLGSRFMAFGLLWLLLRMPRWTRAWVYQAGAGGGGGGMGRYAVLALARRLITRV